MKHKFTTIIVLLVGFLHLTSVGYSQAIPMLSDPIKVREFERASEQLAMTLMQQEAAITVYDRYLENFARIRNNEIKAFEDSLAVASESFGFMEMDIPKREMIEDLIRKVQRAMKAIHRVDSLFLDEIIGMLTEKQQVILRRVRIARELDGYDVFATSLLGQLNSGTRTKLRKFYDSLDLEPNEERDEIIDLYDHKYLKEVKQSFDAVVTTIGLILDMIDELGLRDKNQQALMMQYLMDETALDDLKKRGEILLKPLVDQAYAISQLNWKTWKKLNALLEEEDSRTLQNRYFNASFNEAMRGGSKIKRYLDRALDHKNLLESQKIEVKELQNAFLLKWKIKTAKYAEVLEKSRQKQTVAIMIGEQTTGFETKLATLEKEREAYIEKTMGRIDSILGVELAEALKSSGKKPMEMFLNNSMMVGGMVGGHESEPSGSVQFIVSTDTMDAQELTAEEMEELMASGAFESMEGTTRSPSISSSVMFENSSGTVMHQGGELVDISEMEGFDAQNPIQPYGQATIPKPIVPSFPQRAATVLELDENGEIIISAVYDAYREKYATEEESILAKWKSINEDSTLTRGERRRKTRDTSVAAAKEVAALDIVFFDDLSTITNLKRDDLNLMMLENHRHRQREAVPADPFSWTGGEGDMIDLVGLYVMSDVSDELHEGISEASVIAIRTAMQKYHDQVSSEHEAFVRAQFDMHHLEDAMWLMSESEKNEIAVETIQYRLNDTFTRMRDTKRALMLTNQKIIDKLLEAVPESDFWKVRMEYVQKAYPDVFRKSADITTMLAAASEIQSLNPQQSGQIENLANTYRTDYWNLCEAMIQNHKSNAEAKSGNQMMSKEDMQRQLQLDSLRFERTELNDRIRMRLRMVLNEEQIKQVPGLPPTVTAIAEK